jgi:energy-coupling factor transporter ATP-binding protein EcfA2
MINFHNFINETITVENGGHLFLLGDNGSGKTTVLDAVHYVLTAGQSMEFNSAARVAGNRKDSGRRVQGIVMRYNTGPGELNPAGEVAYAAVELEDTRGNRLVLGMGLSCSSMDEAIQRWGFIRSGTLEDIPFLIEELDGERPRNRREMKAALNNKGFYSQIGSYRDALAARIFGDNATYAEVCKFLATGKAYREIVSRTADYHQLFRELLQEPDPDVFEKVIDHLKTLDNSRQDLDRMQEKLAFLNSLTGLQQEVEHLRAQQSSLRWLGHHLKQKELLTQHRDTVEKTESEKRRLQGLETDIAKTENSLNELRDRINEFSNKDQDGLVNEQRRLDLEVKRASTELEEARFEWEQLSTQETNEQKELDQKRETLIKAARGCYTALHRAATGLPVTVQPILNLLDAAESTPAPEQELTQIDTRPVRAKVDELHMQVHIQKQEQQTRCDALAEQFQTLEKQLTAKRKQDESQPNTEGFVEARQLLAENMFTAQPLYRGLEPRDGISRKELSAVEQIIGEEILSTWVTPPSEENAVRRLLFTRVPAQTLAVIEEDASDQIADWIRHWFDPATSDPFALIALHREMLSANAPAVEKTADIEYVRFRARQQKLLGNPIRLIGTDMRKKQLEQEIKQLEKDLKSLGTEQKKAATELHKTEARIDELRTLKSKLEFGELQSEAEHTKTLYHRFEQTRIQAENMYGQVTRAEEDLSIAHEKLEDVRLRIDAEGLHDLEERVTDMKKKLARTEKVQTAATKEAGALENEIKRAETLTNGLIATLNETQIRLKESQQALTRLGDFEDPRAFIAQFIDPDTYTHADQTEERLRFLHDQTIKKETELHGMVVSTDGQAFRFVYDKAANTLIDPRGMSANQVLSERSGAFQEQQEIITEETRTLFEQFIMQDLLSALRERVTRLMDMSRRINKILKDREFGSNRYAFSAKPLDPYKRLYTLIKNYSEFSAENPARELKEFIEEHQDAIINTEPGDMPELLDYRNWFHYELQVKTGDKETTMDRKTKSIGSGGEQAVPNYLLILTIAHFLYDVPAVKLPLLLFDEAFYGIDAQRRDQLLAFASDLKLQLFVASPDQDGVKKEIPYSTSLFVIKDKDYNIHLHDFHWKNPKGGTQQDLLNPEANEPQSVHFGEELE